MDGLPRRDDGKLDKSAIKRISFILDRDEIFPEIAVAYTINYPIIQPVTKELIDEILSSGIEYDEKKKST